MKFAMSKNVIMTCTPFPHHSIYKYTGTAANAKAESLIMF